MSEVTDPAVPTPDSRLEWRKRKAAELRGLERRTFPVTNLELREVAGEDGDGKTLRLTGYASVTDTPYDMGFYVERIAAGAFKRTLSETPDVQLLVNHDGLPLARTSSGTMTLAEHIPGGLYVDASLDAEDPDVQSLARKMKRGDIDQMSMAFMATDEEWDDDWTQRIIRSVGLHRGDVSVVNQGANPASTAVIRSREALVELQRHGGEGIVAALRDWRSFSLLSLEERAGKTLSASTMDVLTRVLGLVANADDAVDAAQPLLADLMGVPNPDEDEASEDATERAVAPEETVTVKRSLPDHTTRARQRLRALAPRS